MTAVQSVAYRPTREDLLAACRLNDLGIILGWRLLTLVCIYTACVGAIGSVFLSMFYSPSIAGLAGSAAAVALSFALLVLRHALLPIHLVRRQLREQRAYGAEWTLTWSDQGFAVRGETASSDMAWGYYVRWRENARVILFYQTWQAYQFVPKRILPPGAAEIIRGHLRAAGVPEARAVLLPSLNDPKAARSRT